MDKLLKSGSLKRKLEDIASDLSEESEEVSDYNSSKHVCSGYKEGKHNGGK
jgi:hypothetical protein